MRILYYIFSSPDKRAFHRRYFRCVDFRTTSIAGGAGSDATAEAVDGRAKAEGMWKCRRVKIFTNYRSACAARNLASENLRDRPRERPIFQGFCVSPRRQRSWHHCPQLRDLLRVAGGVESDATSEAVDGRAKPVQLGANGVTIDCHSARSPSPHPGGEYGQ